MFTGGWTLERATAVCDENGDEFEVLDLLTRLSERSLVVLQRAEDGSVRYRFLESVWRFALEKLETNLEHAALRERHLATYIEFAEREEKSLSGAGMQQAIQELVPEEENILAALAWCAQAEDGVQRGLRLATAVQRFWSLLGRFALGRRVLEDALARDRDKQPTPARALALTRAAGFALLMGDYVAARPHLEESLEHSRAAGDQKGQARALAGLCVTAMWQSRFDEALQLAEASLAIYRELGEPRGVAMSLHNLGTIEWALHTPDHGRARLEEALQRIRDTGDQGTVALCLSGLASSVIRCGDLPGALERLRECLTLVERLELAREAVYLLDVFSEWLFAAGRPADSARLVGASDSLRAALGSPLMPQEHQDIVKLHASLAQALGEDEQRRLIQAGAALSKEQALSEASLLLNSV